MSRSPTLDILRALAVVLVILRHGVSVPELPRPPQLAWQPIYNLAANGWLGVDVFFVLSGFLLSSQILRSLVEQRYSVSDFLKRRALRTLPAYFAVLLMLWLGFFVSSLETQGAGDPVVLLTHLLFLNDYFGSPLLVTFWSLASEEKFYLLMAALVPLLYVRSRKLVFWLLVTLILGVIAARVVAFLGDPVHAYDTFFWEFRAPFHFAVDGLLMGVLGGFLTHYGYRPRKIPAIALLLLIASTTSFLTVTEWAPQYDPGYALIAIPIVSGFALLGVLVHPHLDTRLTKGWLTTGANSLARISYSLYLTHYPAAKLAAGWLEPSASGIAGQVGYWGLYLCLSLVFGWMLFRLVELPGLRFRDHLTRPGGHADPLLKVDQTCVPTTPTPPGLR